MHSNHIVEPPATTNTPTSRVPAMPAPQAGGWASAAMAIHAIRRMPTPVLLRVDIVGVGTIHLDPRTEGYVGVAAELLPEHPIAVSVETHPVDNAASASDTFDGDLDAVLWFIGEHAFGDERASWLWPGDRYQLTRWPRVTLLALDIDAIKMFAALGAAAITLDELVGAAEVSRERAQRALNALSLMGLLESSTAAPTPPPPPATAPTNPPAASGLFARLRRSLGL